MRAPLPAHHGRSMSANQMVKIKRGVRRQSPLIASWRRPRYRRACIELASRRRLIPLFGDPRRFVLSPTGTSSISRPTGPDGRADPLYVDMHDSAMREFESRAGKAVYVEDSVKSVIFTVSIYLDV